EAWRCEHRDTSRVKDFGPTARHGWRAWFSRFLTLVLQPGVQYWIFNSETEYRLSVPAEFGTSQWMQKRQLLSLFFATKSAQNLHFEGDPVGPGGFGILLTFKAHPIP